MVPSVWRGKAELATLLPSLLDRPEGQMPVVRVQSVVIVVVVAAVVANHAVVVVVVANVAVGVASVAVGVAVPGCRCCCC